MNPLHVFLAGCVTLVLLPGNAVAQACRGRPGFTTAHVIANAGAMTSSDARSVSGGATVGAREGPWASAAIGYVVRYASPTFSTDQTGTSLGATLGYAGTEGKDGRLELCPNIGLSRVKVTGTFFGATATLIQTTRRAGVSAGYTWPVTRALSLIPFVSVEYVWLGGSVKGDDGELPVPEDTYYPIGVGLGTVLGERFGVSGSVTIPTGIPTGHPSFVISLSAALR